MRVKVSTTAANELKDILKDLVNGVNLDKEYIIDFLKRDEGCLTQFKFYGTLITMEDYADVLIASAKNELLNKDNEILTKMNLALMRISKNIDLLSKKVSNINKYNFSNLEGNLNNTLPINTELECNIIFCLDGYNPGSIVDNNTMCLDALFWPSDSDKEENIEDVVLHEFHHIGCLYWLNKNEKRKMLIDKNDNKALAISLIEHIMGEGAAVYFFNKSEDIAELVHEAYGMSLGKAYLDSWNNIEEKLEGLNDLLIRLFTEDESENDNLKKVVQGYSFMQGNEEAKDKVIGKYMCSIIDNSLGHDKLLECFKEPQKLLNYYNEACLKEDKIGLDNDLLRLWNSIWL